MFVTAGDRQEFDALDRLDNTLGKIVRLNLDGTVPATNPFAGRSGALAEIWALGLRNPYGLIFDNLGQLWETENGPKGGDELNLIRVGADYGWPRVSAGDGYDGVPYPRPASGDGFVMPSLTWAAAIAPSGMTRYTGTMFAAWQGDVLVGAMRGLALVRVHMAGETAAEVQRIPLAVRVREVDQAPDGAIWILQDTPVSKLVRYEPVFEG